MREPNAIVVSACSLPFIQLVILKLGISLNQDLYHQMTDAAGNNFDGEVVLSLLASVAAQGCIAFILGAYAYLTSGLSTRICRWLYLVGGMTGVIVFGVLLKNGWSFEFNHCSPTDGCDMSSPLKFDLCVLLGLPMLWCLMLTCIALFGRVPVEKRKIQLERYF